MENNLIKIFPEECINKIMQAIFEEYNKDPFKILMESNLHCMAYKKLSKLSGGNVALHSEVYWKNESEKLRYRLDLSMISKKGIDLYKDGKFEFEGTIDAVIFEFKFGLSSRKDFYESVKRDFDKFIKLSKINEHIFCYFVVLVKNNKPNDDLKELLSKRGENFKFITNYLAI